MPEAPYLRPNEYELQADLAPLPPKLKLLAYGNLIIGPLLALVNFVVVSQTISHLYRRNAPEGFPDLLYINIVIYLVVGALLVIAGVKLYRRRQAARAWGFVAAVSCILAVIATAIVGNTMAALLQSGAYPLRPGQMYFSYPRLPVGVGAFSPLYGIVTLVVLLLPETKIWARGDKTGALAASQEDVVAPAVSAPVKPTSGLAIASFVCSLIPMMLLTQIAALTLGIVALVKIKKSSGAIGGKGFAIAGIIISSLILLFMGSVIVLIYLSGGFN